MPINPAGTMEACKQPLGSGRRKGRPRKLLLSPCRSAVSPAKLTEVIHRTRKTGRSNTITNYFSPRPADAATGAVLEASECPPLAGPAATPPDQAARRRRSCLSAADEPPPYQAKRSWVAAGREDQCDAPPHRQSWQPPADLCRDLDTPTASPPEGAALEAAGTPRTPVSPHKIQSLECEPLAICSLRPPLSPALNFNKANPTRKVVSTKAGKSNRQTGAAGGGGGAAPAPPAADGHHKLTDYFPIRRSNRRTKRALEEERSREIRRRLKQDRDDGLEVALFPGKGRGVVATRPFCRGEFVVEYSGVLVSPEEARQRERIYSQDQNTGCYMYYFVCKERSWCIDGTAESHRLGRLVNHSRTACNCATRSLELDGRPRLVLLARHDIAVGEEILYDYGDRSKESLLHHPWLAS